jgi:hypothetical protein
MALAATEKAKVWTSVRSTYFVVASTSPERRGVRAGASPDPGPGFADATTAGATGTGVTLTGTSLGGAAAAGAATTGAATTGFTTAGGTIVGGGVATSFSSNPSRAPGFRGSPPEP